MVIDLTIIFPSSGASSRVLSPSTSSRQKTKQPGGALRGDFMGLTMNKAQVLGNTRRLIPSDKCTRSRSKLSLVCPLLYFMEDSVL